MKKILISVLLCLLSVTISCGSSSDDPTVFEIRIENTSSVPSFAAQNGAGIVNLYSSVFAVVHSRSNVLFTSGERDAGLGLANLAENGDPGQLVTSLTTTGGVEVIGIANEPSTGSIGFIQPGQSFTLLISAASTNSKLSLATSFLQGNDILVMTQDSGIPLFDSNSVPITGDITSMFSMYDLGTEVNEPPGIGPNQVLRQGDTPDGQISAGAREDQPVRLVSSLNDGFFYPPVEGNIRISISVRELGSNTGNDSDQNDVTEDDPVMGEPELEDEEDDSEPEEESDEIVNEDSN